MASDGLAAGEVRISSRRRTPAPLGAPLVASTTREARLSSGRLARPKRPLLRDHLRALAGARAASFVSGRGSRSIASTALGAGPAACERAGTAKLSGTGLARKTALGMRISRAQGYWGSLALHTSKRTPASATLRCCTGLGGTAPVTATLAAASRFAAAALRRAYIS